MKSSEEILTDLVDKFSNTNLHDGQALIDLYREFSDLDKQFSERVPSYRDLLQMHAEESQLRANWQMSAKEELDKRVLEIKKIVEAIVLLETSDNPSNVNDAIKVLREAIQVQDE